MVAFDEEVWAKLDVVWMAVAGSPSPGTLGMSRLLLAWLADPVGTPVARACDVCEGGRWLCA